MLYFKLDSGDAVSSRDVVMAKKIVYGGNIDQSDDNEIRNFVKDCIGIKCELSMHDVVDYFIENGDIVTATNVHQATFGCPLEESLKYVGSVYSQIELEV